MATPAWAPTTSGWSRSPPRPALPPSSRARGAPWWASALATSRQIGWRSSSQRRDSSSSGSCRTSRENMPVKTGRREDLPLSTAAPLIVCMYAGRGYGGRRYVGGLIDKYTCPHPHIHNHHMPTERASSDPVLPKVGKCYCRICSMAT
eukprot:scaffold7609_cov112-Isochrysis_galbana.AAC.4